MDDQQLHDLTAPFLAADLAQEVANLYLEHAGSGVDPGHATAAVFDAFRDLIADADEGPVILLAIAALQLRRGQMLPPVRQAALALIETGDAARAWRQGDGAMHRQRMEALEQLRTLLEAASKEQADL